VAVYALDSSAAGRPTRPGSRTLHTTATLASRSRPSVLTPGGSYVVAITAVRGPDGADLAARPFSAGLPYASADYVSALITP